MAAGLPTLLLLLCAVAGGSALKCYVCTGHSSLLPDNAVTNTEACVPEHWSPADVTVVDSDDLGDHSNPRCFTNELGAVAGIYIRGIVGDDSVEVPGNRYCSTDLCNSPTTDSPTTDSPAGTATPSSPTTNSQGSALKCYVCIGHNSAQPDNAVTNNEACVPEHWSPADVTVVDSDDLAYHTNPRCFTNELAAFAGIYIRGIVGDDSVEVPGNKYCTTDLCNSPAGAATSSLAAVAMGVLVAVTAVMRR